MIQAILKDDKINVIEFGARIGGGESFRIIKKSTSFDYLEASINSFLGEPVSQDYHIPRNFYADNFIYAKKCKFGSLYCPQHLLVNGTVSYVNELKTSGTDIDDKISSNNRVGVIVIEADNKEDLYQKIDLTIKSIEVFDINNNPVMRKDIY